MVKSSYNWVKPLLAESCINVPRRKFRQVQKILTITEQEVPKTIIWQGLGLCTMKMKG